MSGRSERDEFILIIARECPQLNLWTINRLVRAAQRHQRLMEAQCNRELTPREESSIARIREHISEILEPHKVDPIFSGDPRGATVKLKVPSGRTNDWGGIGICVPT